MSASVLVAFSSVSFWWLITMIALAIVFQVINNKKEK